LDKKKSEFETEKPSRQAFL